MRAARKAAVVLGESGSAERSMEDSGDSSRLLSGDSSCSEALGDPFAATCCRGGAARPWLLAHFLDRHSARALAHLRTGREPLSAEAHGMQGCRGVAGACSPQRLQAGHCLLRGGAGVGLGAVGHQPTPWDEVAHAGQQAHGACRISE